MKSIVLIIALLVGSSLVWQSCSKEGDLFGEEDSRDSFVGTWSVNDQCAKQSYGVDIKLSDNNSSEVIIMNFANVGKPANAIVAGTSITVAKQDVGGGYTVNGNGKINGSTIVWSTYNFETEANEFECTATFKK